MNIKIPEGFYFAGKHVGIKYKRFDLGIAYADTLCTGAAVFTKNSLCGVCIPIGKKIMQHGKLQAIVVTSGVANVATGAIGIQNTQTLLTQVAKEFSISSDTILPSSTGIIGKQLPMEKILTGLHGMKAELSPLNWEDFTRAIMTTDQKIKVKSVQIGSITLLGICKGSGMLEPNMATMLAYFFTDASIDAKSLQEILTRASNASFNMLSVDSDTSTSDTAAILASGKAGSIDLATFEEALTALCIELAKDIVLDARGASRLLEVNVTGAISFDHAKKAAKSIVNSPLVKTAVHWGDPNWGRVLMAVGKLCDAQITLENLTICFGKIPIYQKGTILEENLAPITAHLKEEGTCIIDVDLALGAYQARVWGCDLNQEYSLSNK
jgi:glutamate N-acetyltransferase/amino-acid N-acetyltransferase